MTTTDSSLEERVSRLEGAYEHLATKADIANVETQIAELRATIEQKFGNQTRWIVGFMLTGMVLIAAVVFGVAQLLK